MISVLVIEDEEQLAKNICRFLSPSGMNVDYATNGTEGLNKVRSLSYDVVVLDYNLPDMDGLTVLDEIKSLDNNIQIIMITGEGNTQIAVNAMKAGALDYLTKPLVLKELKVILEKAATHQKVTNYRDYHHKRAGNNSKINDILGESKAVKEVKDRIAHVIEADDRMQVDMVPPTVLILGQTGTGKELVAKAIHYDGPRKDEAFVEINCTAIPSELLEAELFGHEKGAFTGASQQRKGLFESADGGTLFIDEIGDLSLQLQSKLLKVLEDSTIRRLGDVREKKVNVRIVSATHQNLQEKVEKGEFRADLFYRLKVVAISLPPLKDRENDFDLILNQFLQDFSTKYNRPRLSLSVEAKQRLKSHNWPGNIRELKNCIEQAVLFCQGEQIDVIHLSLPVDMMATKKYLTLPDTGLQLDDVEKALVIQAIEKTGGNTTQAAKLLGISRDTLRYRMQKFKLK